MKWNVIKESHATISAMDKHGEVESKEIYKYSLESADGSKATFTTDSPMEGINTGDEVELTLTSKQEQLITQPA